MNANKVSTKEYEHFHLAQCAENKPKTNPNKPNFKLFAADVIRQLWYVAEHWRMDYNHYRPHHKIRGQCNVY